MGSKIDRRSSSSSTKCTGGSQMCETDVSTTNTLAICLAVIIPIVVVLLVIGFFIYKAWKRNKTEALDDNDPDFNGDNIILPDYNAHYYAKTAIYGDQLVPPTSDIQTEKEINANDSTDSFGNPFTGKAEKPPVDPNMFLPFGNSKEELDRYSKNLGLDYHEFNYPIKKMNSSPSISSNMNSRVNSQDNSRRTSFDLNSKPITGHDNTAAASKLSKSPLKQSSLYQHETNSLSPETNSEEDAKELGKIPDIETDIDEYYDVEDHETTNPFLQDDSNANKPVESLSPSRNSSVVDMKASSHTTILNDGKMSSPLFGEDAAANQQIDETDPENLPDFQKLAEKDTPLSAEEEEQLNRMKSVYKVYFSRNGSIKSKTDPNDNINIDGNNLPPLPALNIDEGDDSLETDGQLLSSDHLHGDPNEYPAESVLPISNTLEIPNGNDEYRQSVSSSVYLPEGNNNLNHSGAQGQYAHQQFGNIIKSNQQQFPQQQYAQAPEYYHQQEPYYQNEYVQQPYYQQQYPQEQYYQQQYQNQYQYDRYQQYAGVPKPLPELEALPSPHQLNKRTSTLESFTTFTSKSNKNHVTLPQVPINQSFDPIDHINWNQKAGSKPSPSQIRDSIVMLNPVALNGTKTFIPKGTAKEQIRQVSRNNGSVPNSPSTPLYGFYDNVVERPHGAENLIPRGGSQADLRRQMDNANV